MSEKRRALGRGLGALIPTSPAGDGSGRPIDVFFKGNSAGRGAGASPVSRETPASHSDQMPGEAIAPARAELELAPVPGARFAELSVLSIRPNPKQPRQTFDDDAMAELSTRSARSGCCSRWS